MKKKVKKIVRKVVKKIEPQTREITIVNQSVLAPELVENKLTLPKTWVSEKQVMKMVQQTPIEHIYTRPAKGGGTWKYVTGSYVQKVLNFVFGWLWDFEVVKQDVFGQEGNQQIVVLGKLTVKDGKGNSITKSQYGRSEVKYKRGSKEMLDIGNDFKAAATDALKKCASELGVASDIYGKNELKEVGKTVVEDSIVPAGKTPLKPAQEATDAPKGVPCAGDCGTIVENDAVIKYSKQRFGRVLCRVCQDKVKKK